MENSAVSYHRLHSQETTQPLDLQGVVEWRIQGSNLRPLECHTYEWGVSKSQAVGIYALVDSLELCIPCIPCILRMVCVQILCIAIGGHIVPVMLLTTTSHFFDAA